MNHTADVANLYNQANMIQNKIDKFYNESEKFVNLNKTIVKMDDNLTTYLNAVSNLKEQDYKDFVKNSKDGINKLGETEESELYKNVFTTGAGVLAQWLDGDVNENGNYAANPTRLEGSRESANPFGRKRIGAFGFDDLAFDIPAVSEDTITYRQRAVVDGKLVERDVAESQKDFRKFLGSMVTNVATGLKFESERVNNPLGKDDTDY